MPLCHHRLIRYVLAVAVIVMLLSGMSAAAVSTEDNGLGSTIVVAQEQVEADRILIEVAVEANGTARWNIHYRSLLRDNETAEAFATIEEDIATDPTPYRDRFGDRINQTVSEASTATGREMTVSNISVSTDRVFIPEEYGVVTYSFTWEQFAISTGTELQVGDAIAGMFLDENTRLQIKYPRNYTVQAVQPSPTSQRDSMVSWRGPIDFSADEPAIILSTQRAGSEPSSVGIPLVIGVAVVVLVIVGSGFLLKKRESDSPQLDGQGELLSNEEQVLSVLEENGGRMKQQELVQELGWTDAKTSQVVGNLREDEKLEGFRLGRENVLKLPDTDDEE